MQCSSQWRYDAQQVFSLGWRARQAAKVLRAQALVASSSSRMWKVTQLEITQLKIQNAGRQTVAQLVF